MNTRYITNILKITVHYSKQDLDFLDPNSFIIQVRWKKIDTWIGIFFHVPKHIVISIVFHIIKILSKVLNYPNLNVKRCTQKNYMRIHLLFIIWYDPRYLLPLAHLVGNNECLWLISFPISLSLEVLKSEWDFEGILILSNTNFIHMH